MYDATRVRGRDFYGYHADEGLFVRVALAAPGDVRAAAAACDSGAAWRGVRLPPYEAHIPYLLQFKADHGLEGMGTARLTRGRVRRRSVGAPPPPPRDTWWRPPDSAPDPPPDACLPPGWEVPWAGAPGAGPGAPRHHGPPRSTCAPLEIDVAAADIANAADLVAVPLAALGGEAAGGVHLVPSLRGVWADEAARTGVPPPTPPPGGGRQPEPLTSAAADGLRARLERLVAEEGGGAPVPASEAAVGTQPANAAPPLGLTQADVDWAAGAAADVDAATVAVVAPDDPLDRARPPRDDDDDDDASAAGRDPYAPSLHPDDDEDAALDALAAAAAAAGPCSQEAASAAVRAVAARAASAVRDAADIVAASQAAATAFDPLLRRGAVGGLGGDMEDAAGGGLSLPLRGNTTLASPAAPPDAAHEAGLYGALDALLSQDGGLGDGGDPDSGGGWWGLPQADGADGGPPPRRAPKRRAAAPPPAAPFRPPRRVPDVDPPPPPALESAAARAALMSDGGGSGDDNDDDDAAAAPPVAATAAALPPPPPPPCDLPPTQAPTQVEVDGEPVATAPSHSALRLSSLHGTLHPTPAAVSTPPIWLRPLVPPPTPADVVAGLDGGDPGPLEARPFYSNPADAPRHPVVYGGAERRAPVGAPGGMPPWPGAPTHLGGAGGSGGGGPVWLSFSRVPPPRSVVAAWLDAEAAAAAGTTTDTGTPSAAARRRSRAAGLAVDANSGRLAPGGGGASSLGADALSPGVGGTEATPTPPRPPPRAVAGRGRPSRLSQAGAVVVAEIGDADTPPPPPPPILRPASPRYDEGGYFHCTPPPASTCRCHHASVCQGAATACRRVAARRRAAARAALRPPRHRRHPPRSHSGRALPPRLCQRRGGGGRGRGADGGGDRNHRRVARRAPARPAE